MMEMIDWQTCTIRKLVKPVTPDKNLIKSLLTSADANLKVTQSITQSEESYSSIVILAYDSLRMLLEALALQKGYKIYNHECYTPFLKEILGNEDWSEKFNTIRLIRNSINYYGRRLNKEEFNVVYSDILFLIPLARKIAVEHE